MLIRRPELAAPGTGTGTPPPLQSHRNVSTNTHTARSAHGCRYFHHSSCYSLGFVCISSELKRYETPSLESAALTQIVLLLPRGASCKGHQLDLKCTTLHRQRIDLQVGSKVKLTNKSGRFSFLPNISSSVQKTQEQLSVDLYILVIM